MTPLTPAREPPDLPPEEALEAAPEAAPGEPRGEGLHARGSIEAALERARGHVAAGQTEAAGMLCQQILARVPEQPDALHLYGALEHLAGRNGVALALLEKAARLLPADAQVQYHLGVVLAAIGQRAQARRHYRAALILAPSHPGALRNLGNLALEEGRYREAARCLRQALASRPEHALLHLALAQALLAQREMDAARQHFERALALDPADPQIAWEASHFFLLEGEFGRGWALYEARLSASERCQVWHYPFPFERWRGEPLAGRHLLIHGEQGFGDEILFFSIVPELLSEGGRITLIGQPQLAALWRETFPECAVLSQARVGGGSWTTAVPEWYPGLLCDPPQFQIPMASLGGLRRASSGDFLRQKPYLKVAQDRRDEWRLWLREGFERLAGEQRLPGTATPLAVGLVWAATQVARSDASATTATHNPNNAIAARKDRERSLALDELLPLVDCAGVLWVSLQLGWPAAQLAAVSNHWPVLDPASRLTDFRETAALIATLDLVISVDTAVAHLAGALGKPVWILLPFAGEWRWGLHPEQTLWWPTARLYRQDSQGDWSGVIRRLKEDLLQGRIE